MQILTLFSSHFQTDVEEIRLAVVSAAVASPFFAFVVAFAAHHLKKTTYLALP